MQKPLSVNSQGSYPDVYLARHSVLARLDVSRETMIWQQQIVGLGATFIVSSESVYAYASLRESDIYALRTSDGLLRWRMQIAPYQVRSGVQLNEILHIVLVNETLYVLLRDGTIFALNAEQGTLLWKCETQQIVDDEFIGTLSMVMQYDLLYQTDGNRLYALEMQSVQQRWEHCIDAEQCFLSHTLSSDTIYACADCDPSGTFVYAIDAHSGKRLWRSSLLPDPIFETPLVIGEHLYCVGAENIYALSVQSGQPLWSCPVGLTDFRSPVAIDDLLFLCVRCQDGVEAPSDALLAIQRTDGTLKWYRTFPHDLCIQSYWSGQICVSDGALAKMYVFDAVHGNLLWRLNTSCIGDDPTPGFGASLILC